MDHYTFERIISNLEDTIARMIIPAAEKERKKRDGEYEYIPLGLEAFQTQITVAHGLLADTANASFIDVGCGIGTKVALARLKFPRAYGIEITPEYAEVARRLLSRFNTLSDKDEYIICGNALEHSYKPYDVIYFYCPFMQPDLQIKLEQHLVKTAKKGAIFLANNAQFGQLWSSDKVERVWGHTIYRKV